MYLSEWIILAYLAYLFTLAGVRPMPPKRRRAVLCWTVSLAVVIVAGSRLPLVPTVRVLRTMMPMGAILCGYYLSGLFFTAPQATVEARFAAFDRTVRHHLGATDVLDTAPRAVLELLELSYFACYFVLPAGIAVVALTGHVDLADRYWSTTVLAELGCYAALPFVRTRPGWLLRPDGGRNGRRVLMRDFNLLLVRRTSLKVNTFPSGHVAGGLAAALALASIVPGLSPVFFVVALCIAAGAVAGEYHYAGDAIAGAATALLAWGAVMIVGV